jgi:hypothetical protein
MWKNWKVNIDAISIVRLNFEIQAFLNWVFYWISKWVFLTVRTLAGVTHRKRNIWLVMRLGEMAFIIYAYKYLQEFLIFLWLINIYFENHCYLVAAEPHQRRVKKIDATSTEPSPLPTVLYSAKIV